MVHPYQKADLILAQVDKIRQGNEGDNMKLGRIWTTLAFIRAHNIANMVRQSIGHKVSSGPFKGMQLTPGSMTGAYGPALLGTYEHELHSTFEQIITQPFNQILNIGCAYGYYSVGLALRMPNVIVHSFDIEPSEQQRCQDMAILNNVQDRIKISGEFRGEAFANYNPAETLVLMDIEGGEAHLLDPTKYRTLQKMTIIVELHDVFDPEISQTITSRFKATHNVEIIGHKNIMFDFEQITGPVRYIDPFDSLLINWENRDGPTPWAVLRPK